MITPAPRWFPTNATAGLGGESCLLPWPSSAYLKADPAMPSGFRLDVPIEAMPVDTDGVAIDPSDNGTHSGSNSKPAALRMVERFLLAPQKATDGCALGGSPAPCDCAIGACG